VAYTRTECVGCSSARSTDRAETASSRFQNLGLPWCRWPPRRWICSVCPVREIEHLAPPARPRPAPRGTARHGHDGPAIATLLRRAVMFKGSGNRRFAARRRARQLSMQLDHPPHGPVFCSRRSSASTSPWRIAWGRGGQPGMYTSAAGADGNNELFIWQHVVDGVKQRVDLRVAPVRRAHG
jgi:hypothetical protein